MRIGKVEFPRFSRVDVKAWIYRCEQFFAIDETPDNMKLRYAVIHLEGDAIQWHRAFMKTRGATVAELTWENYVEDEDEAYEENKECEEDKIPQISIHALTELPSYSTMRIRGAMGNRQLHILVDFGSTHNFIDVKLAQKLQFSVKDIPSLNVGVAGGKQLQCNQMCPDFQWIMQGHWFTTEVDRKPCELKGIQTNVSLCSMEKELVHDFQEVFQAPKSLPSKRPFDHRIILKEGTTPISQRPYRYPAIQKDIIKRTTRELLEAGVIRNSQSSFAAPVVLVKKKDGQWRMCMDYRRLNDSTVKDKFPIPLIEELLDELGGATWFSKLDLHSGYHQPLLRKGVLLFFDDILVYSRDMEQHKQHLRHVLSIMKEHKLFAKESKCVFGGREVDYLGHIISGDGVRTDPSKVEAVQEWPLPKTLKQLRGFLGLAGYYRCFIRSFRIIAKPLTYLLKKDAFKWGDEAQRAFEELKSALTSAPVLALLDFSKQFVIETDASGYGLGADTIEREVDEFMRDREAAVKLLKQLLDKKLVKRGSRAAMKILVEWKGQTAQEATWEFLDEMQLRFLDFADFITLPF
uniref:Chromo domain-containing protein n=1 Tax=Tanacetum cinerariifolium TaxID=118510 RepID=A0A6L2J6C9_TANCI|nr:hypothetical protein [Tanacetum cinerariifolium]